MQQHLFVTTLEYFEASQKEHRRSNLKKTQDYIILSFYFIKMYVLLEAAVLGSYKSLLVHRGPGAKFPLMGTMRATIRAWDNTQDLLAPASESLSPASSLWLNPQFLSIPDPVIWASKGVKTLGDIVKGGELSQFAGLKQRFGLPNPYLFRYLQLRHAFISQFGFTRVTMKPSTLENVLLDESIKKTLIGIIQGVLPCSFSLGNQV